MQIKADSPEHYIAQLPDDRKQQANTINML